MGQTGACSYVIGNAREETKHTLYERGGIAGAVSVGLDSIWVCYTDERITDRPLLGLPCGSAGKESAWNAGDLRSIPGLGRSPGESRLPTPVFWPGEFHGLYSPRGRKESDTVERLSLHFAWGTKASSVATGKEAEYRALGPSRWAGVALGSFRHFWLFLFLGEIRTKINNLREKLGEEILESWRDVRGCAE